MSDYNQVPFDPNYGGFADAEFAENAEPRCPCILLLDTSTSMAGQAISELNDGLASFKDELMADSLAAKRVEIAIVRFGPVKVVNDFQLAADFQPTFLTTTGDTPMGAAIERSIEMLRERKDSYRRNGIAYYRPWIFLITDGSPTDAWQNAARLVKEGEGSKAFMFFAVGVKGSNMDILKQISVRDPLRLHGLRFRDLFSWLSSSLGAVSHSSPGELVPMKNPAAPGGWGYVE